MCSLFCLQKISIYAQSDQLIKHLRKRLRYTVYDAFALSFLGAKTLDFYSLSLLQLVQGFVFLRKGREDEKTSIAFAFKYLYIPQFLL